MDEIEYYFKRAETKFNSAKLLYDNGNYPDSVTMSYYVMFLCAKALLIKKDYHSTKHQGILDLFGQHYVYKEGFSQELYKSYTLGRTLREESDYGYQAEIDEETAKKQLIDAKNFMEESKKFLK